MNIPAFVRSAFTASATSNACVDRSGFVDFGKASAASFAWTKSLPGTGFVPFVPAARYDLCSLTQAGRKSAIQAAVRAALDLQSGAFIVGASVTVDSGYLEVWARPVWHPDTNREIRSAIEKGIAAHETPEAPTGGIAKLFYNDDKKRAQMASDRRRSFLGDFADRVIFGD